MKMILMIAGGLILVTAIVFLAGCKGPEQKLQSFIKNGQFQDALTYLETKPVLNPGKIPMISSLIQSIPPYEPQKSQALVLLKTLLNQGFSAQETNSLGQNTAILAIQKQSPDALQILLDAGADIRHRDSLGKTAEDYALASKSPMLLKILEKNTSSSLPKSGLISSLQTGKPENLEIWLNSGGDPRQTDSQGNTALHLACENGFSSLILILLKRGAVLDAKNQAGKTPLELAAQNGFYETVKTLIEQGAQFEPDLKIKIKETRTETVYSTKEKKESGFVFYGRGGMTTHYRTLSAPETQMITRQVEKEFPLLIFAFMQGDEKFYSQILSRVHLNLSGISGESPLHWAVSRLDLSTVQKLLNLGISAQGADHKGYTPLHTLAEKFESPQGEKIFLALRQAGAQIDAMTYELKETPLLRAVLFKKTALVKLLISAGADPQTRNSLGETALHRACAVMGQDPEILKTLLLQKKDPNQRDSEGNTALHQAVKAGNLKAVILLKQAGADPGIKNKKNQTPQDLTRDLIPELRESILKELRP